MQRRNLSAGILYRRPAAGVEVLLMHPGGPLWGRKDIGAWMIPKGSVEPGEDVLAAALREFAEETGVRLTGSPVALEEILQAGGKRVAAFAVEGDLDVGALVSNTFNLEWPPRSGKICAFPEVDRAEWMTLERARTHMLASQLPLLDQLEAFLASVSSDR